MYKILEKKYRNEKKQLNSFLPNRKPDFIIIGAQKSGTTSLHHYLLQHPKLKGSKPKETHFFDKWINYDYRFKWYENHFKALSSKKLFFESSPNYIYYENVAKRIHKSYPNIKLILILRNPVNRAYSAWNMYKDFFYNKKIDFSKRPGKFPNEENKIYKYLMKNRNEFPSFKETIEIELKLIKKKESDEPAILRRGIYVEQIKNYLKYFNKEKVFIMGFNDLVDNLNKVLYEIEEFLNLKLPFPNLNKTPKNKREYGETMQKEDKNFLNEFYEDYNKELFKFLGKKINW